MIKKQVYKLHGRKIRNNVPTSCACTTGSSIPFTLRTLRGILTGWVRYKASFIPSNTQSHRTKVLFNIVCRSEWFRM